MANYRDIYFKQVMFLDDWTCVYCGVRSTELHLDHYLPKSRGGPDIIQNLVAACETCNKKKQARAPYECGFIPRFGRFSYVNDWANECVEYNLDRFTQQLRASAENTSKWAQEAMKPENIKRSLKEQGLIKPKPFFDFGMWLFNGFLGFCAFTFLLICVWGINYYPVVFVPMFLISLVTYVVLGLIMAKRFISSI